MATVNAAANRAPAASLARRFLSLVYEAPLLVAVMALLGLALFGTGMLWALIDRERQFLHDRLAGTRIIRDDG